MSEWEKLSNKINEERRVKSEEFADGTGQKLFFVLH
jgi:hypothetical protein